MEMGNIEVEEHWSRIPAEEPVSTAVIFELADALDEDPIEVTPLAESVDPDALDQLFQDDDTDTVFQFTHEGHTVKVSDTGITVRPTR